MTISKITNNSLIYNRLTNVNTTHQSSTVPSIGTAGAKKYILQRGGHIWLARHGGQVVGTCALLPLAAGAYELAKMAVAPAAQGLGVASGWARQPLPTPGRWGPTACIWRAIQN